MLQWHGVSSFNDSRGRSCMQRHYQWHQINSKFHSRGPIGLWQIELSYKPSAHLMKHLYQLKISEMMSIIRRRLSYLSTSRAGSINSQLETHGRGRGKMIIWRRGKIISELLVKYLRCIFSGSHGAEIQACLAIYQEFNRSKAISVPARLTLLAA